jgi:isoquinoline 1-oxidoreductase beta subunit
MLCAVVARTTWAAIRGRNALKVKWQAGEHASYDSTDYRARMEKAARRCRSCWCR